MPFTSEKQRRYMYLKHPKIAARWTKEAKEQGKSSPRSEAAKRMLKES